MLVGAVEILLVCGEASAVPPGVTSGLASANDVWFSEIFAIHVPDGALAKVLIRRHPFRSFQGCTINCSNAAGGSSSSVTSHSFWKIRTCFENFNALLRAGEDRSKGKFQEEGYKP